MLLSELLAPDRVLVPVGGTDRNGVLADLTRHLVTVSGGDYDEVLAAVREREDELSTAIGHGVAIPHARAASVRELSVVCGVTVSPVPFEAADGEPVRLLFLIVGPEGSAGQHVKVLSRIARLVARDSVRRRLLDAATAAEFYRALLDAEER